MISGQDTSNFHFLGGDDIMDFTRLGMDRNATQIVFQVVVKTYLMVLLLVEVLALNISRAA